MSRIKLKQILSNLHYDANNDQLILSGTMPPSIGQQKTDFIIHGATYVTSSEFNTGSITIQGVNTFGDSGSFLTIDLGEY